MADTTECNLVIFVNRTCFKVRNFFVSKFESVTTSAKIHCLCIDLGWADSHPSFQVLTYLQSYT